MIKQDSRIQELANYKRDFRSSVEKEFFRGDLRKGNTKLQMWAIEFSLFLEKEFPEYSDSFKKRVGNIRVERIHNISSIELLRSQIGNYIHGFIDMLLNDPEKKRELEQRTAKAETSLPKKANVFVVLGRNTLINDSMFSFLISLRLNPIDFKDAIVLGNNPTADIREIIQIAFNSAQAVVVLMTPDEISVLRRRFTKPSDKDYDKNAFGQSRPNVLFEAGWAMATRPSRTVLVTVGNVREFTDVAGIHFVRLTNSATSREEFIDRLKLCGCRPIRSKNRLYLRAGNFEEKNLRWKNEASRLRN